jgi:hypothetical protein
VSPVRDLLRSRDRAGHLRRRQLPELFRQAERTRLGFGTVRLANAPLRRCRFAVEQAYDGRGLAAYQCVNRTFYDWPDEAPDAIRAFDLRDRCSE